MILLLVSLVVYKSIKKNHDFLRSFTAFFMVIVLFLILPCFSVFDELYYLNLI